MSNRKMVREAAKKLYKEQIKKQDIPKNRRMTFSQFFKQYLEMRKNQSQQPVEDVQEVVEDNEDFDFENMVSVNEITDEDVEVQEEDENS